MSLPQTAINPMSVVKTQLSPMPASILKLSGMLNDQNVSQRQITDTLRLDPILAARVLRMANSPVYALQRNVANLQIAVSAIGNQAIQDILLLALTREAFAPEIRNSNIGRKLWVHSLATGFAARELCSMLGMHAGEEAFSCGLLNDIGKVLLWRSDSIYYSSLLADTPHDTLYLAERDYYGFDHAQVGAIAAQTWNLPASVCSVILYHHEPELAVEAQAVTNIINIADHLACYKLQDLEIDGEYLMSYPVVSMGVQADQLEAIWEKVIICLDEVASTFA